MYLCLCVGIVYMSVGIHRDQKRKLDLLELELQMAMNCFTWVLGTKHVDTFNASLHSHSRRPLVYRSI